MMSGFLGAFHPSRFDYPRFALALGTGALGTAVFLYFHWPLPWMLGSMIACTLAALAALPVRAPSIVRPPMSVVLGVLLGASFSADMLSHMGAWIPTLLGLSMFLLVAGAACVVYFRKIGGYDLPTAYFAGMPGGLIEMVLLGQARGGDTRRIALVHSIRILLTASSLPFLIAALGGGDIGSGGAPGSPIHGVSLESVLWLIITGALGAVLGRKLRLPAPYLLGPMIASGAVHLAGWTHSVPPREIVWIAQLVLGVTLGCRFVGTTPTEMLRTLALSLGSFVILIASAVGFAFALAALTPLDVVSIALAYAPGGLVETSVIALALQIEVAFVATHHIVRVVLVMAAAAPIFRWIERQKPS
jgi:membrane AbrB-like protein